MVVAGLLTTPADAKHRRAHKPSWVEQLLTQRADQPSKPRSKHRLKSRGKRHITPNQAEPKTQEPPAAGIPVPDARPAEAQKTDAAKTEAQKTEGPKTAAKLNDDRFNQEKSRYKKQTRPGPSVPGSVSARAVKRNGKRA